WEGVKVFKCNYMCVKHLCLSRFKQDSSCILKGGEAMPKHSPLCFLLLYIHRAHRRTYGIWMDVHIPGMLVKFVLNRYTTPKKGRVHCKHTQSHHSLDQKYGIRS
uniref:Uncharacterized protein n=1 Tax=Paramormyrops kingsleyae TaxID=1676925 RepID=A0A3B3RRX5_9TELE